MAAHQSVVCGGASIAERSIPRCDDKSVASPLTKAVSSAGPEGQNSRRVSDPSSTDQESHVKRSKTTICQIKFSNAGAGIFFARNSVVPGTGKRGRGAGVGAGNKMLLYGRCSQRVSGCGFSGSRMRVLEEVETTVPSLEFGVRDSEFGFKFTVRRVSPAPISSRS
jgi:hypothetical protein